MVEIAAFGAICVLVYAIAAAPLESGGRCRHKIVSDYYERDGAWVKRKRLCVDCLEHVEVNHKTGEFEEV